MSRFFDYCGVASMLAAFAAWGSLYFGLRPALSWGLLAMTFIGAVWYIWYQCRQKALGLAYQHGRWDLALACTLPMAFMLSVPVLILNFFGALAQLQ